MSLKLLSLDALKDLDMGKAHEAFARHLKRAALDCYDRPGDPKARRVSLELAVVPVLDADGSCSEVRIQLAASSVVPKHKTKVYSMACRPNGTLSFNPDSPDRVDQATLLPDDES